MNRGNLDMKPTKFVVRMPQTFDLVRCPTATKVAVAFGDALATWNNDSSNNMGLTYHYSFAAPAAARSEELETFLKNVEGDTLLMGFHPTAVMSGPFDTPERREFSRRVARGLVVEDERLRTVKFAKDTCWSFGDGAGYCRLAPEHGVLLIITDAHGREMVFGFFRYPQVIRDHVGREVMPVPGGGAWTFSDCVKSPDQRYRAIVRRFAAAGYLVSELDEFVPTAKH